MNVYEVHLCSPTASCCKSWGIKIITSNLVSTDPTILASKQLLPLSLTSHETWLPSPAHSQKGSQELLCCALTIKALLLQRGCRRLFQEDRVSFLFSITLQLQLQFGLHPVTEQLLGYHEERDWWPNLLKTYMGKRKLARLHLWKSHFTCWEGCLKWLKTHLQHKTE